MKLVVDVVEPQDGIVFITGYVNQSLAVGDLLQELAVYQPAKKQKQHPKKLSTHTVSLAIETILVEGEPLDAISANQSTQIGLVGDPAPLLQLLSEHQWHESNGRYFLPRKETRLITLS